MLITNDAYCTVKLAKRFAGDIEGTEDDFLFEALIQASSRHIDQYTNRFWGPSAIVSGERIASSRIIGPAYNIFYTKYVPILAVSSLVDDFNVWTENTDYVKFEDEGKIELFGLRNTLPNVYFADVMGLPRSFSRKPGAVQISYTVGWGATGPQNKQNKDIEGMEKISAPADIQVSTAMLAGIMYKDPQRMMIASETSNNEQVTYNLVDSLPKRAKMMLDLRRRHIP